MQKETKQCKYYRLSLALNILFFLLLVVYGYHHRGLLIGIFKSQGIGGGEPSAQVLAKFNDKPLPVTNDSLIISSKNPTLNILFLGNSITRHPLIVDFEPVMKVRGMMATTPDKDYVHQLVSMIAQKRKMNVRYSVANVAEFERFFVSHSFSMHQLDSAVVKRPDVVIVQIGENVSEEDIKNPRRFESEYAKLLRLFPSSKRIVTLPFWPSKQKEYAITNVAIRTNSYLVDISHLGCGTDTLNFAKSQATYKTPGVDMHPGNVGMKHIADCYYAMINAILADKK